MPQPSTSARNTSRGKAASLCSPVRKPKLAETIKVKRNRGQAKMRLKPLGTDAAVVAMA
jgi:hypothetical protein